MPGAVAYGFHEGSRSEYLAQYVFGSWGTAVVIPHQEDHGIDLSCTLMERVGTLFLAKWPYTVQVKSTMEPVKFEGKEAVRWLINHPLPLFLCVVDKASAHVSIYHTMPRFYAWSIGQEPDRLELIPKPPIPGQNAQCTQWEGSYSFSLDQPILDFSITQMMDNTFWGNARNVFQHWIEMENENLTRVRTNLLKIRMPSFYRTNETWTDGWVEIRGLFPDADQFGRTDTGLREALECIGEQLHRREDLYGASVAALLHRHLYHDNSVGPLSGLVWDLAQHLNDKTYLFGGVDKLAKLLQAALEPEKPADDKSAV